MRARTRRYDETATHILLRLTPSLTPVGTIRVTQPKGTYYKLSRLVVLKEYRQFRFGRALVEADADADVDVELLDTRHDQTLLGLVDQAIVDLTETCQALRKLPLPALLGPMLIIACSLSPARQRH